MSDLERIEGLSHIKLAIATGFTDCRGWGPNQRSVVTLAYFLGRYTDIDFDFIEISGDAYIDRFRNTVAKMILDGDRTHLFFIDSDEEFSIGDFLKVLLSPGQIVGAGYPCKNMWEFYGCILNTHDDGRPIVNEHGLLSAQIVPTGFMKIERSVFETLAPRVSTHSAGEEMHFDFFGRVPPLGEDGSFNMRCQAAGIPRWVQPDVTIGHIGTKVFSGNYHEWLTRLPGGKNGPALEDHS